MTESEFEHICRSEYHLSMVANRDGNYDRSCFGFYPHEDSCDNLIPVIERTPSHILGLLNPEPNPNALWRQNLGGNPYAPPLGFESAVLYSPNTPPLLLGDSDSIDPALVRQYIGYALDRIKRNTCEICGNLGAYPTPADPYHRVCHRCRESLHRNYTGWNTSNPQADIHGGIG